MQGTDAVGRAGRLFGVEVEFLLEVPRSSGQQTCHLLMDTFELGLRHLRPWLAEHGVRVSRTIDKATDRYDRWQLTEDQSLRSLKQTDGVTCGYELVSPKLAVGPEAFDQIHRILQSLAGISGVKTTVKAGLHVHLSCAEITDEEIKSFVAAYVCYEPQFDELTKPERRADFCSHARSVLTSCTGKLGMGTAGQTGVPAEYEEKVSEAIMGCGSLREVVDLCNPELAGTHRSQRYHKVNLLHLLLPPGGGRRLEFRQHEGTVDAAAVCHWVALLDKFLDASLALRCPRPADLFDIVGCARLRAFFAEKRRCLPSQTRPSFVACSRDVFRMRKSARSLELGDIASFFREPRQTAFGRPALAVN
ncbi:hypothetical protein DIPPA_32477 [Diplonema papillatum]|nr:hypothetical protein DIPPA_32477 [Diplonema papillatum]